MSQTSITAGALIVAFFIFITVRGELPYYLGAFGLGPMPLQPKAPAGSTGGANFTVTGPGGAGGAEVAVELPSWVTDIWRNGVPWGGSSNDFGVPSYVVL